MRYCKIIGVGGYTPPLVSNDQYIDVFGKKAQQVVRFLSNESRYQTIDLATGSFSISNSQMAYEASKECLSNISPSEVDLIIYCTLTPDKIAPASYIGLQERLGIKSCAGFDIQSGCAGFGTALVVATTLLESGLYNTALVVGVDNISRRFHPFVENKELMTTRVLLNMMMFGDGAGAMLLKSSDEKKNSIYYKMIRSNRSNEPFGSVIDIGGSNSPYGSEDIAKENWPFYQVSGVSEKILPQILVESILEYLEKTGMKYNDIDHYILPVMNKKMVPKIGKYLSNFPMDKVISIEPVGGSMINASIPLSFYYGLKTGKIKLNDQVVLFAGENTKWQHAMLAGVWDPIYVLD